MSGEGFCRDCGAPVIWVEMFTSGKMNPLNAAPDRMGNFHINADGLGVWTRTSARFSWRQYYTSHLATCTHSRPRHGGSGQSTAAAVLYVTPDAPLAVVKAAYRALAQIYHPDVGGDAEAMVRLNKAYEEVLKDHD